MMCDVGNKAVRLALLCVFLMTPSAVNAVPKVSESGDQGKAVERHLANIRQLTFGRKNAEAYFSFDGDQLIFQSTNNWMHGSGSKPVTSREAASQGLPCYQMYTMSLDSGVIRLVSTGFGATTCGYFYPGGRRVLFSSTHLTAPRCPPKPPRSERYRWALHDYDIFSVRPDGQQMQRLTATPGYDAEATVSPNGKTIVFTSMRDGDLDLYSMSLDGFRVKRLTHEIGYDGGAFFSPDNTRIVYRAQYPKNQEELDAYQALLKQNLVEPSNLEIFVMNADGSDKKPVTSNGASNFAPFFHPDGRRIIFSSNHHAPRGREFDIWAIDVDGSDLERITYTEGFDGFPMFSPDGKRLAFASNRNQGKPGETDVYVATWVD